MKVVFVGLGSIAQKHLLALNELSTTIEVFALRQSETAKAVEGVSNLFSLDEIPEDVSFFIVSNPTAVHENTLKQLLPFNRPIFIEKPLFNLINEGNRALSREIKRNGIKTYLGCNLRFHPLLKSFKAMVDKTTSKIEEVNVYCGSYLPDWRPNQNYLESYSSQRELGGGVDLDLIHEIDYVTWFFGFPTHAHAVKNSSSKININAPDAAYYMLQYEDFITNVSLNYFRTKPKRTFEIVFSDHVMKLDLINGVITKDGEEIVRGSDEDLKFSYLHQMQYFVDCLEKNLPIENDIENGMKVLEISLANEFEK